MTVRLADLGDAPALACLHSASFEDGWAEADFRIWLARAEGFATIYLRERDAVAFGLALSAGDDAELLTVAVQNEHRRRGLGRVILDALDAEAEKRGLKRWVLEVARNNAPAIRLYKSAGFVEIGGRTAYYRTKEGRADALVLSAPVGLVSGHRGG